MNNKHIVVEQEILAPLDQIWSAISEKEIMKKWYFDISEFKPVVGFKFQFEGGEEDKRYLHLCNVLEVVPLKKLSYTWQYEGHPGLSQVTFEISSSGKKNRVKITHKGLETFTNPDFSKENFLKGWEYLIQESLKEYIENGKALRYW